MLEQVRGFRETEKQLPSVGYLHLWGRVSQTLGELTTGPLQAALLPQRPSVQYARAAHDDALRWEVPWRRM